MSDLEEILRGVARAFANNCKNGGGLTERFFMDGLRESGLLRLLEAGQAMREHGAWSEGHNWDAAKTAIKEAVRQ